MAARNLKAVPPVDDKRSARRKSAVKSIKDAAGESRRVLLVALRDKIAGELDEGVPARELSSLSLRLIALTEQIAELDAEESGDDVGDAAATPDEKW